MNTFEKIELYKKIAADLFFKFVAMPGKIWDAIPLGVKIAFYVFIGLIIIGLIIIFWINRNKWRHLDY